MHSQMTGVGLDLISACLAVSLFNLAVCLSYSVLLLVSVPMDETFSAASSSAIAYMGLRGATSVRSTSYLHGQDLNDGGLIGLRFSLCGACDSLYAGLLIT